MATKEIRVKEYPTYQFSSLEKFTAEEVDLYNKAQGFLSKPAQREEILRAVSQVLLVFDIYNSEEVEISFLVKPVGEIGKPQYFRFKQPSVLIGRSTESHVLLKSPLVSKKHSEVVRRGVEFYLRDLNSNNGTYLNQVKLSPGGEVVLKNDDIVKVEPFELVVALPQDIGKKLLTITLKSIRTRKEPALNNHVFVFCQILPAAQTAVLAIETNVARWMVQKIITGQKETPLTPWTEIETGLLEYLAAKILSTVNTLLQNSRLILQSVEQEESTFEEWFEKNRSLAELAFETESEIGMIYAFLYLPSALLSNPQAVNGVEFFKKAEWMRSMTFSFSVDLGITYLQADQIALLEAGDILLVERSQVKLQDGVPVGKAEIHSQFFRRGVIGAALGWKDDEICTLTVQSLYQEGLKSMTDATKKLEEGQSESGESVLASVEIPIVIELARLKYTLDELAGTREGQIIELKKTQPDLVDLSVDGKIIASGKLVDIDGKLGVRILKMLK
ncbi:MAG TPA: FliM/FliN family flagellar motor switch protein [Acidobacteriota bacterium]|nr:FliM/FliN family flagellar motor switch protein [Acidobacteriota bacterium]